MEWKDSQPFLSSWFDKDDDIIEAILAPENTHQGYPIFKLQKRPFVNSVRIVVRNYVLSKQVTVIEADSAQDARLGYQELINIMLTGDQLVNPETVKSALEQYQTSSGCRLQNLTNQYINRFPEPLLKPIGHNWNPVHFEADIILVHGLGGDSKTTWVNNAGLWPIVWLLDSQNGIRSMLNRFNISDLPPVNRIRVLTVSHRANMFNIDPESDPRHITQRLMGLLCHAGVGSKPIIWIAHSLGGLIVKEILFASQGGARSDIFNSTKGVVFFGTPHCGATWASILRTVNNMNNSPGLIYLDPRPSIGVGAGNNDRLRALNDFFF